MFVALDLPEPDRQRLARWRDGLVEGRTDLRPVPVGNLHVTLAFLGWQDEAAAERIAARAFEGSDGPAPVLVAGEVRSVPPSAPRLFALDLEDDGGRAARLQAAVSAALESAGVYRPERRPFWPHLTLARVKRGERRVPGLPPGPSPPDGPILAAELTLYSSTLRPQGALYAPLARRVLGGR
ncbi:MAG TPA: RNA 2',3'-cyclic phosphodiesterase [Thermoleophilaceae bacterium]|nr:RNA 2',3'-cyclic phosphodiesterase [Thermoleophilaceae bacterium]